MGEGVVLWRIAAEPRPVSLETVFIAKKVTHDHSARKRPSTTILTSHRTPKVSIENDRNLWGIDHLVGNHAKAIGTENRALLDFVHKIVNRDAFAHHGARRDRFLRKDVVDLHRHAMKGTAADRAVAFFCCVKEFLFGDRAALDHVLVVARCDLTTDANVGHPCRLLFVVETAPTRYPRVDAWNTIGTP